MKILNPTLFVCLLFALIASRCKKASVSPIDQLPAATQTGANTFGCLVNGVAFLPGGNSLGGGNLQCNYQFFNNRYYVLIKGTYHGTTAASYRYHANQPRITATCGYNVALRMWRE